MKKNHKILMAIMISLLFTVSAITPASVLAAKPTQYKVVASGILSRSGLPSSKGFATLKKLGVKSMVNLIPDSEAGGRGKAGASGFRYLHLGTAGSYPPSTKDANAFLSFVKNSGNWPVHVYCKAGNARAGTMVALYRYSVQGWTMQKAIKESKKFGGGPSKKQIAWLNEWARTHVSGAYPK
jgi:tyrosine-protein phosphatase SIW14